MATVVVNCGVSEPILMLIQRQWTKWLWFVRHFARQNEIASKMLVTSVVTPKPLDEFYELGLNKQSIWSKNKESFSSIACGIFVTEKPKGTTSIRWKHQNRAKKNIYLKWKTLRTDVEYAHLRGRCSRIGLWKSLETVTQLSWSKPIAFMGNAPGINQIWKRISNMERTLSTDWTFSWINRQSLYQNGNSPFAHSQFNRWQTTERWSNAPVVGISMAIRPTIIFHIPSFAHLTVLVPLADRPVDEDWIHDCFAFKSYHAND